MELELLDWFDIDKIHWGNMSLNPNAIRILENNPDKIDWSYESINTSIFENKNEYLLK